VIAECPDVLFLFPDLRFLAMIVHYHVMQAALKMPPASAAVPINSPAAVL
jgi:hypothetical protein